MEKIMAAKRDTKSGFTQKTRDRIKASGIVERIIEHALGHLDDEGNELMTPSQLNAGLKLLNKVVPDLKQVENTGTVNNTITFVKPEWLKV